MTGQVAARQGLAMRALKLRPISRPFLGLTLGGFALTLLSVAGAPTPVAAFGGAFGHMGGFGGGVGMGPRMGPSWHSPIVTPRRGGGTYVRRPPGGNAGNGDGNRWPPRHPVIGHPIIVPVPGGAAPPPVANVPPTPPPSGTAGFNGGGGGAAGGMPPRGERRFMPDEVIAAFAAGTTPAAIEQLARRHNITQLEAFDLPLVANTFYRFRINGRRPVGDLVGAIEDERIVASVQPNYLFTLQEDTAKAPPAGQSHAEQYVLGKMDVEQAHRVATGRNVAIALIDSEIDAKNPNLDGVIVKNFDALGGDDKPHQHGTAMAGAIASHGKLVGIAPGAQLLAARAFDEAHDSKGTSFAIYKSLQWAADNGARVVNMSFAGPADPTLHRLLAAAADKGLVLIAAAGNAGPNSPPLYPGADPSVIAVTATDSGDAIFAMANRGSYIAVAAPGVDILALAPGEALQLTTGTSVATAHVSGLAALLIECKPALKPADVRAMLADTAKPLGSGAKLVNAYRAVTSLNAEASDKDGGAPAKE
jgi:subtilase family protein